MIALISLTDFSLSPLTEINGKPLLRWQIENLKTGGFKKIYVTLGKEQKELHEIVKNTLAKEFDLSIIEQNGLPTSGRGLSILSALEHDDVALIDGDIFFDVDWKRFFLYHKANKSLITSLVQPSLNKHYNLFTNEDDQLLSLERCELKTGVYFENLDLAGLYIVSKRLLETFSEETECKFVEDLLLPTSAIGETYIYRSSEYVKKVLSPEDQKIIGEDINKGIPALFNFSHPQKAIFLDRDGTINHFGDFVVKASMLELEQGSSEAIKMINASPYLAICVTNQPIVARGEASIEELHKIHNRLETLLLKEGAYLNDLFFCPHFTHGGFPNEVPSLIFKCNCRKPNIGMLQKAAKRYNIDLKESWMVGDTCQDVQTGINAGCHTVMLLGGDPHPYKKFGDAKADIVCQRLIDAIPLIFEYDKSKA